MSVMTAVATEASGLLALGGDMQGATQLAEEYAITPPRSLPDSTLIPGPALGTPAGLKHGVLRRPGVAGETSSFTMTTGLFLACSVDSGAERLLQLLTTRRALCLLVVRPCRIQST